ncbi:MAG TPA: helix-turn-helix transcriptional regulator [Mycobacteriales bacterium]|nr:helix-turn-helix transcriptional regulator [Mycobacteriales bacterium]
MRLRRLREAQGLSIETLAEKAGVSARQLIRVEHGTTSATVTWVLMIAEALGVHPADLFRDSG